MMYKAFLSMTLVFWLTWHWKLGQMLKYGKLDQIQCKFVPTISFKYTYPFSISKRQNKHKEHAKC